MKRTNLILSLILLSNSLFLWSQDGKMKGYNQITESRVKTQLEFLASDFTEGREPGTPGIEMAAQYIASMYQYVGLKPFKLKDDKPSYLQTFPLIKYGLNTESNLVIVENAGKLILTEEVDYSWYNRSDLSFNIHTDIVFAGYGIEDKEREYNDLKGLDVNNKIVLLLGSYPGSHDPDSDLAQKFLANKKDYMLIRKITKSIVKFIMIELRI